MECFVKKHAKVVPLNDPPNHVLFDAQKFAEKVQNGEQQLVNDVSKMYPHAKQEIEKQMQTLEADLDKMKSGEMTYAQMRALYG
jgi:hypothetical protein